MVKVVRAHHVIDAVTGIQIPDHALNGGVQLVEATCLNVCAVVVNALILGQQVRGASDKVKENTTIL